MFTELQEAFGTPWPYYLAMGILILWWLASRVHK